tara:strand:+ start:1544 stop:1870 length:327 start_codon:yes stop_codon:yes gene_type:complete
MATMKSREKRLNKSLLDFILNNPDFNPRTNPEDFIDINDAMHFTKYLGQALDPKRLGHYRTASKDFGKYSNYIPNYDVRDFVATTTKSPMNDYSKRVSSITKELLKNY